VIGLRERQAGFGNKRGNIEHPTSNTEHRMPEKAFSLTWQASGRIWKRRWNHIAHLRKMAGDGVAAFGAGFFGLPNSAKHLAIDGWWDEGSHPMFGYIYYATISKKQANLVFRSDP
jgi:hypothetical protein